MIGAGVMGSFLDVPRGQPFPRSRPRHMAQQGKQVASSGCGFPIDLSSDIVWLLPP